MILEKSEVEEEENILDQEETSFRPQRQKINDQIKIKTNHTYNRDKYAIFSCLILRILCTISEALNEKICAKFLKCCSGLVFPDYFWPF